MRSNESCHGKNLFEKILVHCTKTFPAFRKCFDFFNISETLLYDTDGDFEKGKRVSSKFRSKRTHGT